MQCFYSATYKCTIIPWTLGLIAHNILIKAMLCININSSFTVSTVLFKWRSQFDSTFMKREPLKSFCFMWSGILMGVNCQNKPSADFRSSFTFISHRTMQQHLRMTFWPSAMNNIRATSSLHVCGWKIIKLPFSIYILRLPFQRSPLTTVFAIQMIR